VLSGDLSRIAGLCRGPKIITGTDPGAGAEISVTVPTGKFWQLLSATFSLVTSATVANRRPSLTLDDGTNVFWRWRTGVDIAASLTRAYFFESELNAEVDRIAVDSSLYEPLAPRLLGQGYRIRTSTTAIQAGDDYGAPLLYVVEYGG
jgi:hypothetical protein